MRRRPKKSYRLLHRLLEGSGQRPYRPVSPFAYFLSRLCEEFPGALPSQILAEMAQGKNNAAIAAAVAVSERAVEKHTNSIFAKLGLSEEKDVNRRVMAVLLFLGRGQGG